MYALVDANSFYAECERAFRPDLRGRPIIVLSNNDGMAIARSKEAKAIPGIDMGEPYFKIKHLLKQHNVVVFSSNYTLYADMSQRVQDILRPYAQEMEVYSIDESFLWWDCVLEWKKIGREMLDRIKQWTGLPVGVGIGPTKTLAKLANHLAKRGRRANGVHVLDTAAAVTEALEEIELGDIWGISSAYVRRLAAINITKPLQLRDVDSTLVRDHLGVVGMRIVHELRGEECIDLETVRPDKKNICCSRSFQHVVQNFEGLREAVSTFASQAALKMRGQNLATNRVGVFLQTNRHAPVEQYAASWAVTLSAQTDDSRYLAKTAAWCASRIFRPEHAYKKAGVFLFDLYRKSGAQKQLFGARDEEKAGRLMQAMDTLNRRHGRGTLRLASASAFALIPSRTWHMVSDHRSPRYTTRWEELPEIYAEDCEKSLR